jgi:hypothetical protein
VYRCVTVPSFPRAVLVTSVIGFTFLLVAHFSQWLLSNHSCCSPLRTKQLPDKVRANPGVSPSSCFSDRWGQNYLEWPVLLHLRLLLCVQSLLSFQRSSTPPQCPVIHFLKLNGNPDYSLNNLQSKSLPEDPADVLLLPGCSCCLRSQFLNSLLCLCSTQRLFLNVRPFGVLHTTLSLPGPSWPCPFVVQEWYGEATVLG